MTELIKRTKKLLDDKKFDEFKYFVKHFVKHSDINKYIEEFIHLIPIYYEKYVCIDDKYSDFITFLHSCCEYMGCEITVQLPEIYNNPLLGNDIEKIYIMIYSIVKINMKYDNIFSIDEIDYFETLNCLPYYYISLGGLDFLYFIDCKKMIVHDEADDLGQTVKNKIRIYKKLYI